MNIWSYLENSFQQLKPGVPVGNKPGGGGLAAGGLKYDGKSGTGGIKGNDGVLDSS